MERKTWLVAGGFVVVVTPLGCRERGEPATTTTTGALSHEDATMRLALARCDREAACNNVGPGKKHPDRDSCVREASQNTRGTLRVDECQALDDSKVTACLNDIKNERCSNPLDSLDTMMSCTRSKLCIERK